MLNEPQSSAAAAALPPLIDEFSSEIETDYSEPLPWSDPDFHNLREDLTRLEYHSDRALLILKQGTESAQLQASVNHERLEARVSDLEQRLEAFEISFEAIPPAVERLKAVGYVATGAALTLLTVIAIDSFHAKVSATSMVLDIPSKTQATCLWVGK